MGFVSRELEWTVALASRHDERPQTTGGIDAECQNLGVVPPHTQKQQVLFGSFSVQDGEYRGVKRSID